MEHQRLGRAGDDIPAGAAGLHLKGLFNGQHLYYSRHVKSAVYVLVITSCCYHLYTGHVCSIVFLGLLWLS